MAQEQYLDQTWAQIQTRLRTSFPESTYQIWLAGLEPLTRDESTLYVKVAEDARDWVSRRFGATLSRAAAVADASIRRVELLAPSQQSALEAQAAVAQRERPARTILKPAYSFDRFVIGESNRFAHGAALTVAEYPGHAYNPFLVYGPSGLGKTHLLQAIGNYLMLYDSALTIRYTTIEAFTSGFMKALHRKEIDGFKETYRRADVLILDDLQSLEGKPKTAEELFHTIDSLLSLGSQVAISSDRHPGRISIPDSRLSERLQSGLVVDICPPGIDTRTAVLQKLAAASRTPVLPEVISYLADHIASNVRALEGALTRVIAFASLTGNPLTVELAQHVLSSLYDQNVHTDSSPASAVTVERIQKETAAALGVDREDLCSAKRSRTVVYARQVSMYLCRELTSFSLPAIAREFGGRDHTTVLHAYRRITRQLPTDTDLQTLVTTLKQSVHKPSQAP